ATPREIPADAARPADKSRATAAYRRRVLRPILMIGGVLLVLAAALLYWLHGGRIVSIDNAYVRAAKLAVSTDVPGIVAEVAVREGQRVRAGDVLFRLEPRRFEIAVAGARASLDQAVLSVEAMKRDYMRMLRDIDAKQAQVQSDQVSFERYSNLVRGGGVTRADYDDARFRLSASRAALESLQEQAKVQLARLGGRADIDPSATPQVQQAQAQLDEAQRQLDHAIVRAPFNAIATQVEQLQPGQYLAAATAAFGLVSTERVWIEASPKETDITHVKPGDPVDVTVDTYPGRVWRGTVDSIAPNSGAEFSVLPPQNASGNWVKVVQRIPLRVRVDRQPNDPELRAGMSVVADIDTGHTRHLSDLMP
ncbi:MAG TPA: HlyD family secretion protein, partial [Acetobacteraceae bacterium]